MRRTLRKKFSAILKANGFSKENKHWQRTFAEQCHLVQLRCFDLGILIKEPVSTCFVIETGIYYKFIPEFLDIKIAKPDLGDCTIRRYLKKELEQSAISYRDQWTIGENGSDIEEVFSAVEESWIKFGIPWFEKYSNLEHALDTIQNEDPSSPEGIFLGNKPCLFRARDASLIALFLGKKELALELFEYTLAQEEDSKLKAKFVELKQKLLETM